MASGDSVGSRNQATQDFDRSVVTGSEESFTYECDACKLDGKIQEAQYYCNECYDFLCDSCETFHKRVKATRFHEVLTGEMMPAKPSLSKARSTQKKQQRIMKICSCNQQREVDVYCADHDDVFCSVCKTVLHKKCRTSTLEECIAKIPILDVFKTTSEKVRALLEKAMKLQKKNQENVSRLQQMEITCKDEIKDLRTEINLLLDKLEVNALDELKHHVKIQSERLKDETETIESMRQLLESDKNECDEINLTKDKRQMFVANNKISKLQHKYELALTECDNSMTYPSITFERNELLPSLETLGKIVTSAKTRPNLFDAEVKTHRTVDVKQPTDTNTPWITGVAFMPNGELLIADNKNRRITLFDSKIKIKAYKDCPVNPWDVAAVSDKEAVATLPDEKRLYFIQIDPNLKFGRSIRVNGHCYGVTMIHDQLYVSSMYDHEIQVLDKKGNVIRKIGKSHISQSFDRPYYIASNMQRDQLFISEEKKLTCITSAGVLRWDSGISMATPRKIFVDNENNLLVCSHSADNIHVLKPDGTQHKKLLTESTMISKPYSIDYRVRDGLLVVGDWDKGYLHLLELC